ncbi:PEP-CTERM sorting domain-containing protein [Nitrosospira sp. NRS527]|uniref:PEP-CTERM sorting domain-containing protein n=1 Tax=Nitrosospira sp. NRS527 TaxID=155925 RepID=UPI001AF87720|nr:PEP-CTERM sorting domain-containing protein [Nitrosospira sp. NRS527]BCT66850.1 hypothetical protein NNRS527_00418 [Nitrosospira sp. NRS527]
MKSFEWMNLRFLGRHISTLTLFASRVTGLATVNRLQWEGARMNTRKLLILTAVAAAFSSGPHLANADYMNIPNGNTFGPADNSWRWRVSWDPKLDMAIRWDPATNNMQKLLNIRQNDPALINLTFEQVDRADTFDRFGLRFHLNEIVTNSTANPWSVFLLELTDDGLREGDFKNPNPNVARINRHPDDSGMHPTKAHFHGDSNRTFDFGPLIKSGGGESESFIQLALGNPVNAGRTLVGGGIGIHDWERVGTLRQSNLRKFDLIEGPVERLPPPIPEPSTFALFGTGLLGLLGYFRMKSRLGQINNLPGAA